MVQYLLYLGNFMRMQEFWGVIMRTLLAEVPLPLQYDEAATTSFWPPIIICSTTMYHTLLFSNAMESQRHTCTDLIIVDSKSNSV